MQEEWREKGLVVVGVHVKESVREDALAICRRQKLNFTSYNTGYVDRKGVDGTPTAYFFNASGELVHKGRFAGHEKKLEGLLEEAPDWLTGPREYVQCAQEAERIRNRVALGEVTKALRGKVMSDDKADMEEAAELLNRLEGYAGMKMKRAASKANWGYPEEALALWKEVARAFKGDEIGEKAAALAKERRADPTFKKELDAVKFFKKMELAAKKLKPRRSGQSVEHWRKRNAASIRQVQGCYQLFLKKYAGTRVMNRVMAFMKSRGL